ncbi:MAG: hypothetical protein ACRC3J_01840 [Culicoidibacterales bacterium]
MYRCKSSFKIAGYKFKKNRCYVIDVINIDTKRLMHVNEIIVTDNNTPQYGIHTVFTFDDGDKFKLEGLTTKKETGIVITKDGETVCKFVETESDFDIIASKGSGLLLRGMYSDVKNKLFTVSNHKIKGGHVTCTLTDDENNQTQHYVDVLPIMFEIVK